MLPYHQLIFYCFQFWGAASSAAYDLVQYLCYHVIVSILRHRYAAAKHSKPAAGVTVLGIGEIARRIISEGLRTKHRLIAQPFDRTCGHSP